MIHRDIFTSPFCSWVPVRCLVSYVFFHLTIDWQLFVSVISFESFELLASVSGHPSTLLLLASYFGFCQHVALGIHVDEDENRHGDDQDSCQGTQTGNDSAHCAQGVASPYLTVVMVTTTSPHSQRDVLETCVSFIFPHVKSKGREYEDSHRETHTLQQKELTGADMW